MGVWQGIAAFSAGWLALAAVVAAFLCRAVALGKRNEGDDEWS